MVDYKKASSLPDPPAWVSRRHDDAAKAADEDRHLKFLRATDYGRPASFEDSVNTCVFTLCATVYLVLLYIAHDHDWRLLRMLGLL